MKKFVYWAGLLTAVLSLSLLLIYQPAQAAPNGLPTILINEVDADQTSTDSAEFVELYDGGLGNTSLDGYVIVFYNGGNTDASYDVYDLDGYSTNVNGFFVLCGDSANVANCDLDGSPNTNFIQNGADAVALYADDASSFPNGTGVTVSNLVDALVYDTNDGDDAELLALLNSGQPQVNEDELGAKDTQSNQRCPDGGTARNTDTYTQADPTPGTANDCPLPPAPELTVSKDAPASALAGQTLVYTVTVGNTGSQTAVNVLITDTLPSGLVYVSDNTGVSASNLGSNVYEWNLGSLNAGVTNTYQLTTSIPLTMPDGLITNNIEVSTSTAGDNTANNSDTANTQIGVLFEDIVSISKTGPAYGIIGDELIYTINIINNSASPQTATITDTLPNNTSYLSDTSGVAPIINGNDYSWGLTVPANSNLTFELTLESSMALSSGTVLTNTVEVEAVGNDNPADNTDTANTTLYPQVSIYDIQMVVDPATNDASPLLDQIVWVEGVVTAPPGEIDNPSRLMYLQDPLGGPWSGVAVYRDSNFPQTYSLGTELRMLGVVKEYFNSTQLVLTSAPWQIEILGQQPIPTPQLLTTADFPDADPSTSEQWEGVYLQFSNVTVTDDGLSFEEWLFSDGSGNARADDLGDRDGNLTYTPANGNTFDIMRGIGGFSFGNYKLYPRNDQDLIVSTDAPILTKVAPANVAVGELFTYTLTVANYSGATLTDITISDVVPEGALFAFGNDGATFDGTEVTWSAGDLLDQGQIIRTFAVTATAPSGSIIVNDDYWVTASNFLTETYGTAVATIVGNSISIPTIQGDSFNSPLKGTSVTTVGIVTGFFEGNFPGGGSFNGFFIQDSVGDGDSTTSDGLFVNHGSTAVSVSIGDIVSVTGRIEEFSEFDINACVEDCMTQIYTTNASNIVVVGSGGTVTPTPLNPVQDTDDQYDYFESLEGMLVTQPATATVVGPTSFGTIHVLAGSEGVSKAFRESPQHGKVYAVRHYERFGDIGGGDPPSLIAGSVVQNVDGPLMTTYGPYVVITQAGDEWQTVTAAPLPPTAPTFPSPQLNEFSVASFNMLNLDAGDAKLPKVAQAVADMGCPSIIGLQEIDTPSTLAGSEDSVLAELVTAIANAGCPTYDTAFSHPDIGDHGVAILWDASKVLTVTTDSPYQGCDPDGSGSSTAYDPISCPSGELPTFSRRPLVLTGTVQLDGREEQIIVVANHFKSQLGGASADNRRLAQAQIVRGIVDDAVTNGYNNVIVLGDLNDFYSSDTLNELVSSGNLIRLWDFIPPQERYSYIFRGLSQALDHILVTPTLYGSVLDFTPQHIDSDYPTVPYSNDNSVVWSASDHDPLVALFQTDCTAQAVTLAGMESGNDLQISWNTLANNTNYDLYQLTTPYGDPLTTGSLIDGTQMTMISTPLTAGTVFYQVVAQRGICSGTPTSTNAVGEFTFNITPGTP